MASAVPFRDLLNNGFSRRGMRDSRNSEFPQGLKPVFYYAGYGTAKAVPFQDRR
jgi:hypothetical protein